MEARIQDIKKIQEYADKHGIPFFQAEEDFLECQDMEETCQEIMKNRDKEEKDEEEEWKKVKPKKERKGRWRKKKEAGKDSLKILGTVIPEGLNTIEEGEHEELDMAVDSAATETVVNDNMVRSARTEEGEGARRGVEDEVANGVHIPNEGEKKFVAETEEGVKRKLCAQVCDVNKALLSVRRVMAAGNRVVFDSDGSFIEDKSTGERMWMREERGLFMTKLWIKKGF